MSNESKYSQLWYTIVSTALATLTASVILGAGGFIFMSIWKTTNRVTVLEVGQNATNRALAKEIARLESVVTRLETQLDEMQGKALTAQKQPVEPRTASKATQPMPWMLQPSGAPEKPEKPMVLRNPEKPKILDPRAEDVAERMQKVADDLEKAQLLNAQMEDYEQRVLKKIDMLRQEQIQLKD